jgi:7-cyano-7-deazaguanine synthase
MPAIVLLSGGLDSAVNLKRAADEVGLALALTFDYGQRAAAREAAASSFMCRQLDLRHRLVALPWLREICTTALVDSRQVVPEVGIESLEKEPVASGRTAEAVWVPNRNGVFVNIAAAFAESLGADLVVAGFNAEEAATFPDNSADFVASANAALQLSTRSRVQLLSYTQHLTKTDIVRLGREIGAPLAAVWSCYLGGLDHCGRCESCARLRRALQESGAWEWFHAQRIVP